MNDYQRIARVIRHLDECHTSQPDLATLAAVIGLSPFHFHRLFSEWAAITPKDFLQCLTISHAKALLRSGESVFDAALGTGLSGPGRLHDLCVKLEAASPGEVKTAGAGWTISFGFSDSPFGRCLTAEGPRGICHLSFVESEDGVNEMAELRRVWSCAHMKRDDVAAARRTSRIFERPTHSESRPTLRAFVRATAFQVRVWRALLQVKPGTLVSYRCLAAALGKPTAARAVGSAVGQNPLAYLIPCHRVIRATGVIGDYRWGSDRKRAMVAWESCPREAVEPHDTAASVRDLSAV